MPGSACGLIGESLRSFDLAGLLVEGLDVPEEDLLGGLAGRVVVDYHCALQAFAPAVDPEHRLHFVVAQARLRQNSSRVFAAALGPFYVLASSF